MMGNFNLLNFPSSGTQIAALDNIAFRWIAFSAAVRRHLDSRTHSLFTTSSEVKTRATSWFDGHTMRPWTRDRFLLGRQTCNKRCRRRHDHDKSLRWTKLVNYQNYEAGSHFLRPAKTPGEQEQERSTAARRSEQWQWQQLLIVSADCAGEIVNSTPNDVPLP
jgi:hypothetical protein